MNSTPRVVGLSDDPITAPDINKHFFGSMSAKTGLPGGRLTGEEAR